MEPEEKYGVADLIDAIWKEIPDCINRYEADTDMLGVKWELENMEEPYITAEAYQKICEKHNILQSGFQRGLLNWFKDLGVAYFYEPKKLDTLVKSVRVLNPAWLTNGIYITKPTLCKLCSYTLYQRDKSSQACKKRTNPSPNICRTVTR